MFIAWQVPSDHSKWMLHSVKKLLQYTLPYCHEKRTNKILKSSVTETDKTRLIFGTNIVITEV